MNYLPTRLATALAAAGLLASATPALALDAGNILVRAGIGYVSPNDDSNASSVLGPGADVTVDNDASLAVTLVYMATKNIGVELVGALPFNHDIKLNGTKIADTDQLPPTLLAQWYFMPDSNVRPYVGAGVNYTTFFNTKTTGPLKDVGLNLDSSWGLAGEAGIDFDLGNNWMLNAAVWYMDIDTTAKVGDGIGNIDVQIDPWVGFIGAGYRF